MWILLKDKDIVKEGDWFDYNKGLINSGSWIKIIKNSYLIGWTLEDIHKRQTNKIYIKRYNSTKQVIPIFKKIFNIRGYKGYD